MKTFPMSTRGMISRAMGEGGRGGSSFSPLDLSPLAWARSSISTLYQDPAGATPVTGAGQDIGAVDDQGSLGGLWSQITGTATPTYEIGPARRVYDPDDALPRTLPAISGGQIVIISPAGTWIDDFNFAGGTFTVGPDTYTGGPAGLMSLLGNAETEIIILPTPMTAAEQAKMVSYAQGLGSAGLITLEATALVNGTFDSSLAGWSLSGVSGATGFVWASGRADFSAGGAANGRTMFQNLLTVGKTYLCKVDVGITSGLFRIYYPALFTDMQPGSNYFFLTAAGAAFALNGSSDSVGWFDNVELYEVIMP